MAGFVDLLYCFFFGGNKEECLFPLEPGWRSTDTTSLPGSTPDDTLMHRSFDAVIHFQVQLGELVLLVGRSFLDISQRGGIHNVAHNEPLDSLVLRDGLSGRDTTDTLDVTAALLITSMSTSLYSHLDTIVETTFVNSDEIPQEVLVHNRCWLGA